MDKKESGFQQELMMPDSMRCDWNGKRYRKMLGDYMSPAGRCQIIMKEFIKIIALLDFRGDCVLNLWEVDRRLFA